MNPVEFTIIDAATGAVKRFGSCPDSSWQYQCQAGELIVAGLYPDDQFYWDAQAGAMAALPPSPGPYHRWDAATKVWNDSRSLDQLKAVRQVEIEARRDAMINEPIVYQGANLDADATAQRNISTKLLELDQRDAAGLPMPVEMLVWRDADNLMHTFTDQASYRAWLGGLALVIAERGSAAYSWSWQKKAELAACTTFDQVITLAL
jgi:hypothetical protein